MDKCSICYEKANEKTYYIELMLKDRSALICAKCIEGMTDVVEEYWLFKEREEEETRH